MASSDLVSAVLELADGDSALNDSARLIILGALDSDDALADAIGGVGQTWADVVAAVEEVPPPIGAYLKSISVAGFRGIGERLTIPLHPGPGLTIIAGRNGSGKSSIAEALEMALTGQSYRWLKQSSPIWTTNWRNLHSKVPAEIRVELAEEGRGALTIGMDWSSDAGLGEGTCWVQRAGGKRQPGRDTLGWAAPLNLYRPLLSYDELGGVLEGRPSDLHDKLNPLLGLELITEGQKRLTATFKRLQEPAIAAKTALAQLKVDLAASDDARAAGATALLAKRPADLAAVAQLATGGAQPDQNMTALKAVTRLTYPDPVEVRAAAAELKSAVADLAEQAGSAVEALAERAALLAKALDLHSSNGDMDCPVCGVGHLDASWAEQTRSALAEQGVGLAALSAAERRLDTARRQARRLIDAVPALPRIEDEELTRLPAAAVTGDNWRAAPADDLALADHLARNSDAVTRSFSDLRVQAEELATAREDRWVPLAMKLGAWVGLKRAADQSTPLVVDVKTAADWLKARSGDLRNQRLAPLADRARHIWAQLRQESNVDLGAIRLEGQATSRRVQLSAQVDGVEAGALGVMSQGELHALALALFLPRATAPDSPFRFIVLDDPIQAMDPAKVQGFVQVLQELSVERQVIVLSHDDRLPSAVRRTRAKANIFEVTRSSGSGMTVTESMHPASRYIDDAFALATDDEVPSAIKDRIIPSLCRMALEAAAFEHFETQRISDGVDRRAVEEQWAAAPRLKQRIALAIHGDKTAEITNWLKSSRRSESFGICNGGVHTGSTADHAEEVRAVRSTVKELRATR